MKFKTVVLCLLLMSVIFVTSVTSCVNGATLPYQTVVGTTDISINVNVWTDMPNMSLTVAQNGTYEVSFAFAGWLFYNSVSQTLWVQCRLLLNDVSQMCGITGIDGYGVKYVGGEIDFHLILNLTKNDVLHVEWKVEVKNTICYCYCATSAGHRVLSIIGLDVPLYTPPEKTLSPHINLVPVLGFTFFVFIIVLGVIMFWKRKD